MTFQTANSVYSECSSMLTIPRVHAKTVLKTEWNFRRMLSAEFNQALSFDFPIVNNLGYF